MPCFFKCINISSRLKEDRHSVIPRGQQQNELSPTCDLVLHTIHVTVGEAAEWSPCNVSICATGWVRSDRMARSHADTCASQRKAFRGIRCSRRHASATSLTALISDSSCWMLHARRPANTRLRYSSLEKSRGFFISTDFILQNRLQAVKHKLPTCKIYVRIWHNDVSIGIKVMHNGWSVHDFSIANDSVDGR